MLYRVIEYDRLTGRAVRFIPVVIEILPTTRDIAGFAAGVDFPGEVSLGAEQARKIGLAVGFQTKRTCVYALEAYGSPRNVT